jgi:hypothetical protein
VILIECHASEGQEMYLQAPSMLLDSKVTVNNLKTSTSKVLLLHTTFELTQVKAPAANYIGFMFSSMVTRGA